MGTYDVGLVDSLSRKKVRRLDCSSQPFYTKGKNVGQKNTSRARLSLVAFSRLYPRVSAYVAGLRNCKLRSRARLSELLAEIDGR